VRSPPSDPAQSLRPAGCAAFTFAISQTYRELELIDPDLARRYPLFGTDDAQPADGSAGRAAEQDPVGRYLIDGWAQP